MWSTNMGKRGGERGKWAKRAAALACAAMLVTASATAFADAPQGGAQPGAGAQQWDGRGAPGDRGGMGGMGRGGGMGGMIDTASLTEDQKTALATAQQALSAAEDQALALLVSSGLATQQQIDDYIAARDAQAVAAAIDQSGWTVEQAQALRDAQFNPDADHAALLADYVTQGLLTQAQADAYTLATGAQNPLFALTTRQGDMAGDAQKALGLYQDAQWAYRQALEQAGIQTGGPGSFGGPGGPGMPDGQGGRGQGGQPGK